MTCARPCCPQGQDFIISDIFYKIQNLKKWKVKALVHSSQEILSFTALYRSVKWEEAYGCILPSGGKILV